MFPQVSSVFFNWTSTVQMQIIKKVATDFELQEDIQGIVTFDAVIQAMKAREVMRKPENERIWKWWTMWSQRRIEIDTVIQDPNGVQFRVQSIEDWSQGGFYKSELTEQPKGL